MRLALLIIAAALLTGCSPWSHLPKDQRQLKKLLWKYPHLSDTVVIHDTVEAVVEYVRADTVLRWVPGDTIYLSKDRLRVRTVIDHDTVWQEGECLEDTIYVPVRYEVPVVQPERVVERVPWWVFVLLTLFAIMTTTALFKR